MRRNPLGRVERLIAVAAQDKRCVIAKHLVLDSGDERADARAISGHVLQMQEKRPRRGEIGVRAFVERAAFVLDAAGNEAPETVEELKIDEGLQPPHGRIGGYLSLGQIQNGYFVGGHDDHLTVGDVGNRNSASRRFVSCRLTVGPSGDRR